MGKDPKTKRVNLGVKELKELRGELWVIPPFFIFALIIFVGSFQYKFEAAMVPMLIGGIAVILAGMRFFHILFPTSKIGEFKEAGLAGEFDSIEKKIKEETLKDKYEEEPEKALTFREEKKAFIALISCFVVFLLFGYLVGICFTIVGTSYYYGFKKKGPLLMSLIAMYIIVYILLIKLLEGPMFFGLVFEPILKSLDFI